MYQHKIKIELEIEIDGNLFIGSGFGDSTINRRILRDSENQVYIPASSIKGVIRNSFEKLVTLYDFPVKSPHDNTSLDAFKNSKDTSFITDKIFGSKFDGDKLFFKDAKLSEKVDYDNLVVTRNTIERSLNSAKDGHLFSTEYATNLNTFKTDILGYHNDLTIVSELLENKLPAEYEMLIASILITDYIGGNKSVGSGKLLKNKSIIKKITYNNKEISFSEAIKAIGNNNFEDFKIAYEMA